MNDEPKPAAVNGHPTGDKDFAELRSLLLGADFERLRARVEDPERRADDVGEILAEAVTLRRGKDGQLRRALQPVVEQAIRISVQRDPALLSDALYPVIGAAVRKALSSAMRALIESLNQTLEQSFSLRGLQWRIDSWRSGKSFGEVLLLHSQSYRVEQVFLIHKRTGLLLQHMAVADVAIKDAGMVSGMLTAIQDFVSDSFGPSAEELDVVQVGDFYLWIQHGGSALLACVVRGIPPTELRRVLQESLSAIHSERQTDLDRWEGQPAEFESTRKFLAACLLGKMAGAPKASVGLWALAGGAVLLVLVGGFLFMRHYQHWNGLVERLRKEPGIVVTQARWGLGGYVLSGLRDPLAADPQQLIAQSGIRPADVQFHWEPYQSLQPRFATIRKLQAQAEWVEAQGVYFRDGDSTVEPASVASLARGVRNLLLAADEAGRSVRVDIVGQTDPMGDAGFNARLAPQRAKAVMSELVQQGIPVERLVARGATEEEVSRNRGLGRAYRFERNVWFRVTP